MYCVAPETRKIFRNWVQALEETRHLKKAVIPKRRCHYLTINSAYTQFLNIFYLFFNLSSVCLEFLLGKVNEELTGWLESGVKPVDWIEC